LTSPFFSPTTGDCTTTTDCSPSALPPTSPATGGARTDGAGEGSAVGSKSNGVSCFSGAFSVGWIGLEDGSQEAASILWSWQEKEEEFQQKR
uniref:Uncharacterized protein n=1 Tax=Aegilops tauschii subsp. strangulata TaxID=200361 RepID=A0A453EIV1_AEGTS